MALALFLVPVHKRSSPYTIALTALDVGSMHQLHGDLLAAIRALPSTSCPPEFLTLLSLDNDESDSEDPDWHYGDTQVDGSGESVRLVSAGDLKPLQVLPAVRDDSTNRCVWAYVNCLQDDDVVALVWW